MSNQEEVLNFIKSFQNNSISSIQRKSTESKLENLEDYKLPSNKKFGVQYSNIYYTRLIQMRGIINEKIKINNPSLKICNILTIPNKTKCAVIVTLYKEMKKKPNILFPQINSNSNNFCSSDDQIYAEDDTGFL